MKVAYFLPAENVISETFVSDLAAGLMREGADVQMAPDQSPIRQNGLGFEQRPWMDRMLAGFARLSGGRLLYLDRYRCSRAARQRVEAFLRHSSPDVAYVDYATQAVLLAPILERLGLPFVLHVHGFDVTATMSNPFFVKQLGRVFSTASAIIAPSQHLRRRLILAGCEPAKIEVVHYEPCTEGLEAMPIDQRSDTPSIVALGRLTPKKNPQALIHAFALVKAKVPEARLTWIGEGPLAGEVRQLIDTLGLADSVELTGALPRRAALERLRTHWIFAQHSVTSSNGDQEGFPVSPLEAAALGLPIITTAHSGLREQVLDGETGFLVPEHDYEAMGQRLADLLSDRVQCESMGSAAKAHVAQICPLGARAQAIADILRTSSTFPPR